MVLIHVIILILQYVLFLSISTRPSLLYQFKQLVNILTEGDGVCEIMNHKDMKNHISHISDEKIAMVIPPSQPTFINQFRRFSLEHLVKQTLLKLESKRIKLDYSPPSPPCIDQPIVIYLNTLFIILICIVYIILFLVKHCLRATELSDTRWRTFQNDAVESPGTWRKRRPVILRSVTYAFVNEHFSAEKIEESQACLPSAFKKSQTGIISRHVMW